MIGAMRNWKVDTTPFLGHEGSVEDIAWSPAEARVFASSSIDKTIKLWDCRAANKAAVMAITGHQDHVNVISWNTMITHLIASGADDGVWKVHDLRMVR
jgi:ribosome assembly protein RRB1